MFFGSATEVTLFQPRCFIWVYFQWIKYWCKRPISGLTFSLGQQHWFFISKRSNGQFFLLLGEDSKARYASQSDDLHWPVLLVQVHERERTMGRGRCWQENMGYSSRPSDPFWVDVNHNSSNVETRMVWKNRKSMGHWTNYTRTGWRLNFELGILQSKSTITAFVESGTMMVLSATIVYSVHLINFDDDLSPETLKCCYEYLSVLLIIFPPSVQLLAHRLRTAMCDRKISLVWQ